MTEKKSLVYDESNIKILGFPEAVRKKATYYIGPVDGTGVWTIVREPADNTVDEALAGRNNFCHIHIDADEHNRPQFWIRDNGAGIPVKNVALEDGSKMPAIQAILTKLHSSGKFDDKAYAVARGCFSGDTKVRLLSGRTVSMEKLYERWQRNQTKIPIMSFNRKTMKLEPSNISHVQLTKYVTEMAYVYLDDGSVVKTTTDHPFVVNANGRTKKVKAVDLQQGQSLVSTYYSEDRDGYLVQTEQGRKLKVHRLVASAFSKLEAGLHQVHHVSRDKLDNRPSNLEVVTTAEHQREHFLERSKFGREKILQEQVDLREENSTRFSSQNVTEEHKQESRQTKAVKVATRVLHRVGKLNKVSYESCRRVRDMAWDKAVAAVGSKEKLVCRAQARLDYLKSRVGKSSVAEDELADAFIQGRTALEVSRENNWNKTVAGWKSTLLAAKDPRNCTPEEFNNRKGASVFGRYALMSQFTKLVWLKDHVLDGKPLRLFSDLSVDAKQQRMLWAETQMRDEKSLRKMASYFASSARKAKHLTDEEYAKVKASCAPQFDFGKTIVEHLYGPDLDLEEFVQSYNHSVEKVVLKRFNVARPVYDITVDKTHSFFIEPGVCVMNTHGLGMKATNALSLEMEVWTCRDGAWYSMQFSRGILQRALKKCAAPVSPLTQKPLTKGTLIRTIPDSKIFSSLKFPLSLMVEWARISAYFTPSFKVLLSSASGSRKEIYYPEGPKAYTKERVAHLKCTPLSPDVFLCQNALIDCVAQFTDFDGIDFAAFTNGLRNVEGGVHTNAFFQSLAKAIEPFKRPRQEFTIQELKEGVVGIINAKLSAPQFDSQTKEKLVDARAGKPVFDTLVVELTKFFKGNRSLADKICTRCDELRGLKNKFKASKDVLKELRKVTSMGFPENSSTSPKAKPEERELFLVEGDSAGGCFVGSTELLLANGNSISYLQLVEDFKKGIDHVGLAFDVKNHKGVPFTFDFPHVTKHTKRLIKVELEDGTTWECTPDHKWLTKRGWVEAQHLVEDDDIISV